MIAFLHDSRQAAVGDGFSCSSIFRDSILQSLARQASTCVHQVTLMSSQLLGYKGAKLRLIVKFVNLCILSMAPDTKRLEDLHKGACGSRLHSYVPINSS